MPTRVEPDLPVHRRKSFVTSVEVNLPVEDSRSGEITVLFAKDMQLLLSAFMLSIRYSSVYSEGVEESEENAGYRGEFVGNN